MTLLRFARNDDATRTSLRGKQSMMEKQMSEDFSIMNCRSNLQRT